LSWKPLTVRATKGAVLRGRVMRNGVPVSNAGVNATLMPAASGYSGSLNCPAANLSDKDGYVACAYRAPAVPLQQAVIGESQLNWDRDKPYARAEGTITVLPPQIVLGFFNGVWNTEKQAEDGLTALRQVVGPAHGDIQIRYEKFYNQTGRGTGNTEAQDIAETFIQRSAELNGVLADRWEHYWEMLSGRHRLVGSFTERLLSGLRDGGVALSELVDSIVSAMLAGLVRDLARLMSNPPTAVDMAAHLSRLRAMADEGNDFVLVAHSQGNLFVNVAHDGLKSSHPEARQAVVHVAPASPTVRGKHVLSDLDAVINGLRNFGSWTVQATNLWLPFNSADTSGHTLVGTYLNGQTQASTTPNGPPDTTPRAHVKGLIVNALNQVSAP
jgi:hypothetical protein